MIMFKMEQLVEIKKGDSRGKKGTVVKINDDGSATVQDPRGKLIRDVWPEDCEPL